MAKYSRFDPRNKKNARNKQRSLDRDIRLKEERKTRNGKKNWDYADPFDNVSEGLVRDFESDEI